MKSLMKKKWREIVKEQQWRPAEGEIVAWREEGEIWSCDTGFMR